jgi:hypothetical protein
MKKILLILLTLISCSIAFGYDYESAQAEANKKCAGTLYFPLDEEKPSICGFRGYVAPTGNWHGGNDYDIPVGTRIRASDSGLIVNAVNDRGNTYPNYYDWGNVVMIRHASGLMTVYGHLQKAIAKIQDFVFLGQIIGLSGNSGYSQGPHIHYEARIGATDWSYGTPVDPYPKLWASLNPIPTAREGRVIQMTQAEIVEAKKIINSIFPREFEVPNPFERKEFMIISCNIPEGSKKVSCMPVIKLKFSQPVDVAEVYNAISITPIPLVNYIFPYYFREDDKTEIGISAFMLQAHTDYQFSIRSLKSLQGKTISLWQRNFTTAGWPHEPFPRTNSLMIHQPVIHLGNDHYENPINTGFQKSAQGISWQKEFFIEEVPEGTKIRLRIRGSDENNRLYLNEQLITLPTNTQKDNGEIKTYPSSIAEYLRVGRNVIRIESYLRTQPNEDYDDFEVSEIELFW